MSGKGKRVVPCGLSCSSSSTLGEVKRKINRRTHHMCRGKNKRMSRGQVGRQTRMLRYVSAVFRVFGQGSRPRPRRPPRAPVLRHQTEPPSATG